jgi:hypothetical protein
MQLCILHLVCMMHSTAAVATCRCSSSSGLCFIPPTQWCCPPAALSSQSAAMYSCRSSRVVPAALPCTVCQVSAALRQLYPDAPAAPKEALITRWGQDPYALGSYSFMAVGSTPADTAALAAPVSNVLFWAGEATRRDYPSTVHGAYLSGQAAATAVQQAAQASSGGSGAGGGAASASNGTRNAAARVQPSVWGQVLLLLVWVGAGLWQLV